MSGGCAPGGSLPVVWLGVLGGALLGLFSSSSSAAPQTEPAQPEPTAWKLTDAPDERPPLSARAAERISADVAEAERRHLLRVAVWGASNMAAGAAVMGGSAGLTAAGLPSQPELFGLGFQATAWGAINLAIVGVGAFFLPEVTGNLEDAVAAEDTWRTVLLVNEGLNATYVMAGLGLVLLGFLTPDPWAAQLRGHGAGIVLQGVGLLFLDGLALLESRPRRARAERFRSWGAGEAEASSDSGAE